MRMMRSVGWMMNEQYKWLWRTLREQREQLQRAAEFYERSPDGQYDELASLAIRAVLEQMRRDDEAKGL